MPRIEDEDDVLQQLDLRELLAVLLSLDQPRQHIARGIARPFAPIGHQDAEIGEKLSHRRFARGQKLWAWCRLERAQDRERPVPQR